MKEAFEVMAEHGWVTFFLGIIAIVFIVEFCEALGRFFEIFKRK